MKKILINPTVLALFILTAIFLVIRYTPYFNYLNYKR